MSPEPYIGSIFCVGGNYAPHNTDFCAGQILPISDNTDLFALIGDTFGGDGRTTVGLPDLRGRAPIGAGIGFGLPPAHWGFLYGSEVSAIKMTKDSMPGHTHTASFNPADLNNFVTTTFQQDGAATFTGSLFCHTTAGGGISPRHNYPGATLIIANNIFSISNNATMAANATASGSLSQLPLTTSFISGQIPVQVNENAGGLEAIVTATIPPMLASNYVMTTDGLFPPRT
ncbi:MAG: tail fiber protein [bacterium]|nr:tail fiber protein [bacterium]